jgi:hypothetical protein
MNASEFSSENSNAVEVLLWRFLTPTAYQQLREGFQHPK